MASGLLRVTRPASGCTPQKVDLGYLESGSSAPSSNNGVGYSEKQARLL
jgi:hypothetical protein